MKKLLLAIFLLATSLSIAQLKNDGWVIFTTIDTAGAGLTGAHFLLPSNAVPVAVYVDTLTDASTLSWDVLDGAVTQDSADLASGENWRTLTETDDGSTNWTATLTDDKWIPLDPAVMMSLIGRSDAYPQQTIWLRPLLSAKQDEPITLYIKIRWI